jgi:hypothetical protein
MTGDTRCHLYGDTGMQFVVTQLCHLPRKTTSWSCAGGVYALDAIHPPRNRAFRWSVRLARSPMAARRIQAINHEYR